MNKKERIERLKSLLCKLKNAPRIRGYSDLRERPELAEIYAIAIELCMPESDFLSMYRALSDTPKYRVMWSRTSTDYNFMPKLGNKDNTGTYVGNGGSNRQLVRYPKKTKSRRVWAKFYNMFPERAKRDNWDGTKSDRMK